MLRMPIPSPNGYLQTHSDTDLDHEYCVTTLWGFLEELPRNTLPASLFEGFMTRFSWGDKAPVHTLAATDENHWQRVLDADLGFPVMFRKRGSKTYIVDGYHRVVKAFLLDRPWILGVDVTNVLEQARVQAEWEQNCEHHLRSA